MLKYKQKAGKQSWQEVSGMKINEVSKMYDITADTLRYYERIGLIPAVNRNESGIRDYMWRCFSRATKHGRHARKF